MMKSSDWKVWRYLTREDAQWIIDKDAFKAMTEQGWICRTVLWVKGDEIVTYPDNLLRDIKKVAPNIEWPEKIEEKHRQGLMCALSLLQDEVQTIIRLRYYQGASYTRIAELLEMSHEGIRQIIKRTINALSEDPYCSLIMLGLDEYINQQTAMRYNSYETFCIKCGRKIALSRSQKKYDENASVRQQRIAAIDKFFVEIIGPEYARFGFIEENSQNGFCLYATVTNISGSIHTVNVEDFFLVKNGIKIPSDSKLIGTTFGDNVLIAKQMQQTGLIWYDDSGEFFDTQADDISVVVSLQVDGESSKYVYKFDFRNYHFELDDFTILSGT